MKKFLFLLLLPLFGFGQFNPIFFGGARKQQPNTYIGGVSSVLNSASAVASSLSVSADRIQSFSIIGNDIQFRMVGSYTLGFSNQVPLRTLLKYYYDNDGLVANIDNSTFNNMSAGIIRLYFPGIITQTGAGILQDIYTPFILEMPNCITVPANWLGNWNTSSGTKTVVLPKCTNFGVNELNNSVFAPNGAQRMKLYVPISKQTSNAGGVEGDVAFVAGSTASSIVYVPNYTKPNAITDLSAGTITSSSVQFNFTAPSSTNTLAFYEVYLNGIYKGTVTASGQTISGLTTATLYKSTILAVDIYYNKSLVSNSVFVTTL